MPAACLIHAGISSPRRKAQTARCIGAPSVFSAVGRRAETHGPPARLLFPERIWGPSGSPWRLCKSDLPPWARRLGSHSTNVRHKDSSLQRCGAWSKRIQLNADSQNEPTGVKLPGRHLEHPSAWSKGFPRGASGKGPACQCRKHKRHGFHPWVGKIPWRRKWQPTPVSSPGEPRGQRSPVGRSPWVAKTRTRLSDWRCAHTPGVRGPVTVPKVMLGPHLHPRERRSPSRPFQKGLGSPGVSPQHPS